MKMLIALIIAVLPLTAFSQTTVSQGNGNASAVEWRMNVSANRAGKTTEVCVTNAAGGTVVPTTALTSRKAIEIQNLGPNAIYCTVDGQAPLSTGALGRKIAADAVWSLDIGGAITVKCIAATAAQATPACTQVTELR